MATEKFRCKLQYLLPQHLLSRFMAKLADCKIPLVKNALIKLFIYCYQVDLNTAAIVKLSEYPTFNHFFTRALNKNARMIDNGENVIVSPCDGTIVQVGEIQKGKLLQAKGSSFYLNELLGGDKEAANTYQGGNFITVYLAPHDYHRVHMPILGTLISTCYVPGKLFSVNSDSVQHIPNLFCKNERLVCYFATELGEMALIMVGAMLVAGIETVWGQRETPCQARKILVKNYSEKNITIARGEEMGRFLFGSTVILLFPPNTVTLQGSSQQQIQMGSSIGRIIKAGT